MGGNLSEQLVLGYAVDAGACSKKLRVFPRAGDKPCCIFPHTCICLQLARQNTVDSRYLDFGYLE